MSKSYQVVISAEAERNIEEAFSWIAQSDHDAAVRWYTGLIAAIKGLVHFPLGHPISPETRHGFLSDEVRQLLYGRGYWKYRILFVVEDSRILMAHIRHGARLYLGQEED